MTISYSWLKDYINVNLPVERVGELLTNTGLEVEGIEKIETIKGGLAGVLVGEVLTCIKHPNADRLKVTTVNIGAEEPLQIVCGAPNVAVGQKVPVATVGTMLYPDDGEPFKIKKGKIRGEVSQGMICAEDELGLGESHDGIMVLDNEVEAGITAADYFKVETDYAIEIGLTPNRTDAMCHYGVARDLRAALIQQGIESELAMPKIDFKVDDESLVIPVKVKNVDACPKYLGVTISDVEVAASPAWLQNKLRAIGLKPINNVVDATNFVLHETGHPLHAFDAQAIAGNEVVIKNLASGTKFTTLDDVERTLDDKDLMICNTEEGMCIAGVFGGNKSGVTENTKSVFLEAAWFNPISVRKTAKRHALNTDASYRYERGVDFEMTEFALKRAAMLIKELGNGKISSQIQRAVAHDFQPITIRLEHNYLNTLVGNDLSSEKVEEILASLEFEIKEKDDEGWMLSVPSYRVEVTRPADVVEEVLRIYGFNNVELPKQMRLSLTAKKAVKDAEFRNKAIGLLTANGYTQIMNNSLTKVGYYTDLAPESEGSLVHILNPLSNDLGVMRQNLLFGAMEVVRHNINRQHSDIAIFEFGKSYFKNDAADYTEKEELLIALSGNTTLENWNSKLEEASFFNLKAIVEMLLSRLGIEGLSQKINKHDLMGEQLHFISGEKVIVQMAQVPATLTGYFDVSQPVFVAEINWQAVVKKASRKKVLYTELPKYPFVRRDLALLVNTEVTYEEMRVASAKAGGKLLKNINLFDVYTGNNLPEGTKSYAMSFIIQDAQQTLTDKRVDGVMDKVLKSLQKQFDAKLR